VHRDPTIRMKYIEAKRIAIHKCLETAFKDESSVNVISIGDSVVEQQAVKREAIAREEGWSSEPSDAHPQVQQPPPHGIWKTLVLLTKPTYQKLLAQQKVLLAWLPRLVQHSESFDHSIEKLDEQFHCIERLASAPTAPRTGKSRCHPNCLVGAGVLAGVVAYLCH